jgi:DNA-3-methyladenine glycosylase II
VSVASLPARSNVQPTPLSALGLAAAVDILTTRDRDLAEIVGQFGQPPLWDRRPGFATLLHIILEQQVSLASAKAAFDRLLVAADPLTTTGFLALTDEELLAVGFSRQKALYGRALARAVDSGSLDLEGLTDLDDRASDRALQSIPGVGPWTSAIYRMMVLGRPDVWPVGDIALAASVCEVKGLAHRPDATAMEEFGEAWRPWRSVAARLFWHAYLARRGRSD